MIQRESIVSVDTLNLLRCEVLEVQVTLFANWILCQKVHLGGFPQGLLFEVFKDLQSLICFLNDALGLLDLPLLVKVEHAVLLRLSKI